MSLFQKIMCFKWMIPMPTRVEVFVVRKEKRGSSLLVFHKLSFNINKLEIANKKRCHSHTM